jgi:hypothetical protein
MKFQALLLVVILLLSVSMDDSIYAQNSKGDKMPKEELEKLMDDILPLAQKMLKDYGEFFPYGGSMTKDGKVQQVGSSDGTEHPPSQKLIELMIESFRADAKAGRIKATAIVMDVRITLPDTDQTSDAILVRLEHIDGLSLNVFFPYSIKGKGEVVYGKTFAQKGEARIFKE